MLLQSSQPIRNSTYHIFDCRRQMQVNIVAQVHVIWQQRDQSSLEH